ncbi:hypothetical protein P43SY_006158 [Pythium insidiosum]|uniref:Cyclic nucleotide-binding domain-containing protein n=1 Tax=Pythium insidiosum TaxID=114742 RepID=A0AAD5LFA5_PYTIN|nr:hypothetical protein P43SY_006158 [Pythium insidiosum]
MAEDATPTANDAAASNESTVLETMKLPRGGVVASTCIGPVQLGMPPETIKDSMKLGIPVPRHYIVPSEPFTKTLGANMGVNVAEFEFPAYCNFFFKRQCVNLIVTSAEVEQRIRQVFQETLFGPASLDLRADFPELTPEDQIPDLQRELEYFRKFGDTLITLDMLLKFTHFDDKNEAVVVQGDQQISIRKNDGSFTIVDGARSVTLTDGVELPPPPQIEQIQDAFYPPAFGVTVLGSSHGFDPHGKTSGYVLWINHRGIMIDPPPFSSSILIANNIPALMIDGVILTHCHADHDAGTFQKILQEGRVALITTNTIYRSFLRKYSALSGFDQDFLKRVLDHRLVRVNDLTTIRGAEFRFFYSLHSIPCVGFEVKYGDKRIVFSGDTLNDVERIKQLHEQGVLTETRCNELLNFPWHCDAILHEAGVPPIHTPLKTLMNLEESIRKRVYVVHTAAKDIPADCGLRGAPEGVHATITLDTKLPENAGALEILDLVRKIDLFTDLTLNNAYEILQMARRVTYPKGSLVKNNGDIGDKFYIIIVGEAQAQYRAEGSNSSVSAANAAQSVAAAHQGHNSASAETSAPLHRERHNSSPTGRTNRKRVSMLSLAKNYFPGDYFDLQSLLTPNWALPYQMMAMTKLSLLEFNAVDFHWFLRHTHVASKIQKLAQSRLCFSYDIIEMNQVFRKLTPTQRTHLEILLNQKDVQDGQVLWEAGGRCSTAVIIDKGQFTLKYPRSAQASQSARPSSPSSSLIPQAQLVTRKHRGSGNRIVPLDLSTLTNKTEHDSETVLTQGSFVGDVDRLIATDDTTHTTTLVCTAPGSVFYINKHDLQVFLLENPGILMSLSGRVYVRYARPTNATDKRDANLPRAPLDCPIDPTIRLPRAQPMERPTRRSAAAAAAAAVTASANGSSTTVGSNSSQSSNGNSTTSSSSSRRRRRGADDEKLNGAASASASDGAETDSSSTVMEGSSRPSGRKATRASRAAAEDNNATERLEDDGHEHVASDDEAAGRTGRSTRGNGRKELDVASPQHDGSADDDGAETASQESAPIAIMTRSRRERSQSVVSTTSDTSSIVSEAVEEDTSVSHEEKLQELEKKKRMVEDGTLAEYCRRVAEFKEERNRLLQTAEWHKNLQVKNTQDLYGFEMQRARNIWSDRKEELKNAMLTKTDALLLKLQRELELLDKSGELPRCLVVDRSPRGHPALKIVAKKDAGQKENEPQSADAQPVDESSDSEKSAVPPSGVPLKRRKIASPPSLSSQTSAPVPDNVLRLPLDDITADLASIFQSRQQHSGKVQTALSVPARLDVHVERRRLVCGKYVFEEGDEVVITATVLREDYIGVITSVANDELFVKLSTGQKARILVEHLARRRCEIRPFLRGSAGLDSLHATGWVECEPF